MNQTATIYHTDGRELTVDVHQASRTVYNDKAWSFTKPPPAGWQFETPRYKATRDVHPSPRARYRMEPPFETMFDPDQWQYGTKPIVAGEIVETRDWPHPSFRPLNYGAQQVHAYFSLQMKSRLPTTPWHGDQIRLDNGFSGPATVNLARPNVLESAEPQPRPSARAARAASRTAEPY
jgi:hypothetical protein